MIRVGALARACTRLAHLRSSGDFNYTGVRQRVMRTVSRTRQKVKLKVEAPRHEKILVLEFALNCQPRHRPVDGPAQR